MEQVIQGIEIFNGEIVSFNDDELVVKMSDDSREKLIVFAIMHEFFEDIKLEDDKFICRYPKVDIDPY